MKRSSSFPILAIASAATALLCACAGPRAQDGSLLNNESKVLLSDGEGAPVGAIFVSPSGDDDAIGTQANTPLRTIAAAVAKAPAAGTIILRGGDYREGGLKINKPVTIKGYDGERVVLKGSDVVAEWQADGGAWVHTGWSPALTHVTKMDEVDPARPQAARTDAVFIDDQPQEQVLTLAAVSEGTFYVDSAQSKLYLGTNPTGKTVEATTRNSALTVNAKATGTKVSGLHLTQYAQVGLTFTASDGLIENSTFTWMGVDGATLRGADRTVVRDCRFDSNGQKGLNIADGEGMVVDHSAFAKNNREGFKANYAAGGMKAVMTRGAVVKDSFFEKNAANAIWFDISSYDTHVYRNTLIDNEGFGIFYELGHQGEIVSNVIAGSKLPGIGIADTSDVRIYNNTIVDSRQTSGIFLKDSERAIQYKPGNTFRSKERVDAEKALGITWLTRGNVVRNNLVVYTSATRPFIAVENCKQAMVAEMDHNGYARPAAGTGTPFISWYAASGTDCGAATKFASLAEFQAAVGMEQNSKDHGTAPVDSLFVNATASDYVLSASSPAAGKGGPLPADIATMIEFPADGRLDQGAVVFTRNLAALRAAE